MRSEAPLGAASDDPVGDLAQHVLELAGIDIVGPHHGRHQRIGERLGDRIGQRAGERIVQRIGGEIDRLVEWMREIGGVGVGIRWTLLFGGPCAGNPSWTGGPPCVTER